MDWKITTRFEKADLFDQALNCISTPVGWWCNRQVIVFQQEGKSNYSYSIKREFQDSHKALTVLKAIAFAVLFFPSLLATLVLVPLLNGLDSKVKENSKKLGLATLHFSAPKQLQTARLIGFLNTPELKHYFLKSLNLQSVGKVTRSCKQLQLVGYQHLEQRLRQDYFYNRELPLQVAPTSFAYVSRYIQSIRSFFPKQIVNTVGALQFIKHDRCGLLQPDVQEIVNEYVNAKQVEMNSRPAGQLYRGRFLSGLPLRVSVIGLYYGKPVNHLFPHPAGSLLVIGEFMSYNSGHTPKWKLDNSIVTTPPALLVRLLLRTPGRVEVACLIFIKIFGYKCFVRCNDRDLWSFRLFPFQLSDWKKANWQTFQKLLDGEAFALQDHEGSIQLWDAAPEEDRAACI